MTRSRILTGITCTGIPHLGNYVGAIQPAVSLSQNTHVDAFIFLADYHAIIKQRDPSRIQTSIRAIAATWLACGLDSESCTFYRQSDVPEITELTWLLSTITAKGLMNRAHAYKAAVQENTENEGVDPDKGIEMGLFNYPILMAADILMFQGEKIPIGKDQIQHVEMARDIAQRFNYLYGNTFTLPEVVIEARSMILPGLDGRKMSKSYDNTIPLFSPEKKLRKLINKIKTNSLEPGVPKDPEHCSLFAIYSAFCDEPERQQMRQRYEEGIGWGEMKQYLFEYLNEYLKDKRAHYDDLMQDPSYLERQLALGAEKARALAVPFVERIKASMGIGGIQF